MLIEYLYKTFIGENNERKFLVFLSCQFVGFVGQKFAGSYYRSGSAAKCCHYTNDLAASTLHEFLRF